MIFFKFPMCSKLEMSNIWRKYLFIGWHSFSTVLLVPCVFSLGIYSIFPFFFRHCYLNFVLTLSYRLFFLHTITHTRNRARMSKLRTYLQYTYICRKHTTTPLTFRVSKMLHKNSMITSIFGWEESGIFLYTAIAAILPIFAFKCVYFIRLLSIPISIESAISRLLHEGHRKSHIY